MMTTVIDEEDDDDDDEDDDDAQDENGDDHLPMFAMERRPWRESLVANLCTTGEKADQIARGLHHSLHPHRHPHQLAGCLHHRPLDQLYLSSSKIAKTSVILQLTNEPRVS